MVKIKKGGYHKMALIKVPENREKEMLDEFCEHSMFTFEGIDIVLMFFQCRHKFIRPLYKTKQ